MFYKNSKMHIVIFCLTAVVLNNLTAFIFHSVFRIPLFFDTIFTVATVFYLGLVPALCVSICYDIVNSLLWAKVGLFDQFLLMYGICGILIVFSTWIIARNKEEFKISVPVTLLYLLLIALVSSFCTVISSGIIDFDAMNPIKKFTEGFVHQGFSLFASCILAQIPISFLDRLITTFAGYGVYKLCNKFERR